jgi:hypothetical protein
MTSEAGCNGVPHLFSLKLLASLGTLFNFYCISLLTQSTRIASILRAPTLYPSLTCVVSALVLGTVSDLMSEFTGDPIRYGLGFDVRIHWGPLVI